MTDIWEEKPFSLDDLRVDNEGNPVKSEMDAWLEKLKADWEQRELVLQGCEEQGYISINPGAIVIRCGFKEKAEKWDLLVKVGGPPQGDKRIQWHIDMSNMRMKLEAVKTWTEENIPDWVHRQDWFSGKVVKIISGKLLELDKILEGEDLQSIGETQT